MAKRYSQETKEKAQAMRQQGYSYAKIGAALGCTGACVRYWCDDEARALNAEKVSIRAEKAPDMAAKLSRASAKRCGQAYEALSDEERLGIEAIYRTAKEMSKGNLFFEVDHIVPVKEGGQHRIWNLRIVPRFMNRIGRGKQIYSPGF